MVSNEEKLTFFGEATSMTDRNGTVHGYNHDVLGRETADIVTTLASGVDGTIRRLGFAFNTQGASLPAD